MNYTERTTVNELISYLNTIIRNSFNFRNYELVEVIQKYNKSLICVEEAPPLINSNEKILDYFNIHSFNNPTISFYVRIKDGIEESCMVCQESDLYLSNRYNCSHKICNECFNSCVRFSINNCSLCRSI